MPWSIVENRSFKRGYKRLSKPAKLATDEAIGQIASDPAIGKSKVGNLTGLLVYKFKIQGQLFLIGYTLDNEIRLVYLEDIGSHQNFYRDLAR
jgi:mRNA-degrading endonuclease RelE of RelBE toxin-antitoxin system